MPSRVATDGSRVKTAEWRQGLRARSKPARFPHRALCFQGDGRADGEDCRPADDGTQAARIPAGVIERGADLDTGHCYYVKSPVFPWNKFPGVDTVLGPEMKSTGEVMGVADNFGEAFAKAQLPPAKSCPRRARSSSASPTTTSRVWPKSRASLWIWVSSWWLRLDRRRDRRGRHDGRARLQSEGRPP